MSLIALIIGYTVLMSSALAIFALVTMMLVHAGSSLGFAIRLKRRAEWRKASIFYLFAFCYTHPDWAARMLHATRPTK